MTSLLSSRAPSSAATAPTHRPGWLDRRLRRAILHRLAKLEFGRLVLEESWTDEPLEFAGSKPGPSAEIAVTSPEFYRRLGLGGANGAGTAYRDGLWRSSDPAGVVRLMLRNRATLEGIDGGWTNWLKPGRALAHWRNRNTRRGSRRNIVAHYDLGNDFFARFLDKTMTYSAAFFDNHAASLREAQTAKLDRLCRKLRLDSRQHVLEIGGGWGSFAVHAASRYGCRVTSTTISPAQLRFARAQAAAARVEELVEFVAMDYRDLEGQFDRIVSIEMIEAVGSEYLGTYLANCDRLLRPDGLFGLQAITIRDQHYTQALRRIDFIKRYIFPGSFIPSATAIIQAATRSTNLRTIHLEDFGAHYAETLRRWRAKLQEHRADLRSLGYEEEFLRTWDYYLCYCEGGFEERALGVSQIILEAPGYDGPPVLSQ